MNDDYLWDKTGEPDPQIKQLEEILGTLRYKPQPLEIPKDLPSLKRRNFFPWAAIAATLLLALLAGGIWLSKRSSGEPPAQRAKIKTPAVEEKKTLNPEPTQPKLAENNQPPGKNELAVHFKHPHRSSSPALTKQELDEALIA